MNTENQLPDINTTATDHQGSQAKALFLSFNLTLRCVSNVVGYLLTVLKWDLDPRNSSQWANSSQLLLKAEGNCLPQFYF